MTNAADLWGRSAEEMFLFALSILDLVIHQTVLCGLNDVIYYGLDLIGSSSY